MSNSEEEKFIIKLIMRYLKNKNVILSCGASIAEIQIRSHFSVFPGLHGLYTQYKMTSILCQLIIVATFWITDKTVILSSQPGVLELLERNTVYLQQMK